MFDEFISEIVSSDFNVHGFIVYKDGKILFSHMFHEDIRYPIYSATKTLTSAVMGIISENKMLDIYKPLAYYLDDKYISVMPEQNKDSFRKISVERFLTMSVKGFPFRPYGDDWLKSALECDVDFSAEPEFSYSNISAYLAGIACENAVGQPLMDFISENILIPLGIENPPFQTDPQGRFYGATGMHLSVDELNRIGRLYLEKGKYNGIQIIPENWIDISVKTHILNSDGGYGYFIWTKSDSFSISGKWGQKCLIYPKKNLLITYMSDMPENSGKVLGLAEQLADRM